MKFCPLRRDVRLVPGRSNLATVKKATLRSFTQAMHAPSELYIAATAAFSDILGHSRILMLAPARGMLDGDDDDFFGCFINRIIDEIRILARDKLADTFDLLPSPDFRKDEKILNRVDNRGSHAR